MLSKQKNYYKNLQIAIKYFQKSNKPTVSRLYKFLYTVLISVSVLPFLSRDVFEIKKGIDEKLPALDSYYYQRIFSIDANALTLGNFYVDSNEFSYRSMTVLSIGETVQKLIFKLLRNNILTTYFFLTLVYLIIWIILITKLVSSSNNYYQSSLIVIIFILLFLGNSRIPNNGYPFARLISPQFTMMLWLLGIFIIKTIYLAKANPKKFYWYVLLYSIILMISSFSYLYSFLSLVGSGIILVSLLFFEKKYRFSISLLALITLFSLPSFIINSIKSKENRFMDATERMGMISGRFPGSVTTILLCSVVIIFIFFQSYLNKNRLKIDESKKAILIMSLGILLASQSQLITNIEIQFYHFNFFAQTCLMLALIHFLNNLVTEKFNSLFNKYKVTIYTAVILIFVVSSFGTRVLPIIQYYNYGFSNNAYNDQINPTDNVIMDELSLQYTFPIYSRAKVLYQADMAAYGYSNIELLDRAYVSAGCPSKISNSLKSELLVYRLEGIKQKYNSIMRYLNLLGFERNFSNYREKLIVSLNHKEKEIENEFNNYLLHEKEKDCFQKAKDFDIDVIIFDKKSNWNSILNQRDLEIESFGLYGLMKVRI